MIVKQPVSQKINLPSSSFPAGVFVWVGRSTVSALCDFEDPAKTGKIGNFFLCQINIKSKAEFVLGPKQTLEF